MGILECFGGIPVKSKRLNPNSRNAEERSNSKRLRGKARTTAGLTMNPELTDTMLALPRRRQQPRGRLPTGSHVFMHRVFGPFESNSAFSSGSAVHSELASLEAFRGIWT